MHKLVCRRTVATAVWCALLGCLLASPGLLQAAEPASSAAEEIAVQQSFNGQPFSYQIRSKTAKDNFDLWQLTYPSPVKTDLPQNNIVPAEYYLPKGLKPGDAKRPAVICMHILGGNFELTQMMCGALASHGIPAIMFKLPYYAERGPAEGPRVMANRPQLFIEALSQGILDVRRTVDLLAARPEVDPQHIGITGISLGGIVTVTAAGVEPRLTKALPILAGGDIAHILMTSRETTALKKAIESLPADQKAKLAKAVAAVEPLEHAAELKARAQAGNVLMINAAQDEIIPRQCTEKLAQALGISDKVVWLEGLGHYTAVAALPQIMQTMVTFFAADLPTGTAAQTPATGGEKPLQTIAALLKQANTFMSSEPKPDTCHSLDLEVKFPGEKGKEMSARVRFLRGNGKQFRLHVNLPVVGEALLGHGEYPWAVSGDKKAFRGSVDSENVTGGPLRFVNPDYLLNIQVAAGTLAGIAMAPEIMEQAATISDATPTGGPRTLKIEAKDDTGNLLVVFAADGTTPHEVAFEIKGIKGKAIIHGWQTDAAAGAGMFEPPHGVPVQQVEKGDLYRIFAAMLNFAMENLE
jgi:dienelactone hydrolase